MESVPVMRSDYRPPAICECGKMAFVASTKGRVAFFDAEDMDKVSGWNWSSGPQGHLYRRLPKSAGGTGIMMHHAVFGRITGLEVDHINGNSCDNRKENLRHVNKAQNQMNRSAIVALSGFKGVSKNKKGWLATIRKSDGGKKTTYCLGTYTTKEEAAAAYDRAAIEMFGAFAKTNQEIHRKFYP